MSNMNGNVVLQVYDKKGNLKKEHKQKNVIFDYWGKVMQEYLDLRPLTLDGVALPAKTIKEQFEAIRLSSREASLDNMFDIPAMALMGNDLTTQECRRGARIEGLNEHSRIKRKWSWNILNPVTIKSLSFVNKRLTTHGMSIDPNTSSNSEHGFIFFNRVGKVVCIRDYSKSSSCPMVRLCEVSHSLIQNCVAFDKVLASANLSTNTFFYVTKDYSRLICYPQSSAGNKTIKIYNLDDLTLLSEIDLSEKLAEVSAGSSTLVWGVLASCGLAKNGENYYCFFARNRDSANINSINNLNTLSTMLAVEFNINTPEIFEYKEFACEKDNYINMGNTLFYNMICSGGNINIEESGSSSSTRAEGEIDFINSSIKFYYNIVRPSYTARRQRLQIEEKLLYFKVNLYLSSGYDIYPSLARIDNSFACLSTALNLSSAIELEKDDTLVLQYIISIAEEETPSEGV